MKGIKAAIGIVVLLVSVAIAGQAGKYFSADILSPKADSLARDAAVQLNKKLPVRLDEATRLDKVTSGPGARVSFYYTLTRVDPSTLTVSRMHQDKNALRERLLTEACDDRGIVSAGVGSEYNYRSSDGSDLFSIAITPEDCARPRTTSATNTQKVSREMFRLPADAAALVKQKWRDDGIHSNESGKLDLSSCVLEMYNGSDWVIAGARVEGTVNFNGEKIRIPTRKTFGKAVLPRKFGEAFFHIESLPGFPDCRVVEFFGYQGQPTGS